MHDGGKDPVIVAERLSRIYSMGAGAVIGVTGVDLRIAHGALVVLKGNSGSGKSTLLSLLAGLDNPSSGTLTVAGCNLKTVTEADLTRYRREIVGMIFQSFNLLPTLSVLENVCLPRLLAGHPHDRTREKAIELLTWLSLSERLHHLPAQLSGGEMQRTAIARALINDPAIILADEPTGNLDSHNGRMVIELLAELNQKWRRTVIIATHSDMADPYASMQICLKDGVLTDHSCDL